MLYVIYIHMHTYIHTYHIYTCIYIHTHPRARARTHTHTHTHTRIHIYIHTVEAPEALGQEVAEEEEIYYSLMTWRACGYIIGVVVLALFPKV